jgi:hypothetical protein
MAGSPERRSLHQMVTVPGNSRFLTGISVRFGMTSVRKCERQIGPEHSLAGYT